jgi:hypothetical protein
MWDLWDCFEREIPEANSFVYLLIEKATMENILISIVHKENASDDEKRMIARKRLIAISNRVKKTDVDEGEIQHEIDQVRRKSNR